SGLRRGKLELLQFEEPNIRADPLFGSARWPLHLRKRLPSLLALRAKPRGLISRLKKIAKTLFIKSKYRRGHSAHDHHSNLKNKTLAPSYCRADFFGRLGASPPNLPSEVESDGSSRPHIPSAVLSRAAR